MTDLATCVLGKGPAIVFLHGWGFDSRIWRATADAMADAFTVVCIDLPGYGGSRGVPVLSFDDTVTAVLRQVPGHATLIGWSLGGMLALACARREPARIGRLVLVATTPSFVRRAGWPHGMPVQMLADFKASARADLAGLRQHFAGLINHGDRNARALTRHFKQMVDADEPVAEALMTGLDWLSDVDLRDALSATIVPTMLAHGERDPLIPIAGAWAMAERIPQARLESFDGVAHAPFFGDPTRFAHCLRGFALPGRVEC